MKLEIFDRFIEYQETKILFNCVQEKAQNIEEKVFVLEHKDVYTAGKSILNKNINYIKSVPVYYAERGGLLTWHGKGQVVVYFIYNLKKHQMSISDFMNVIEKVVVKCVNEELDKYCNIAVNDFNDRKGIYTNVNDIAKKLDDDNKFIIFANQDKRGFWIKDCKNNEISKFGFIGLKVSNGYVYHGISINYNNDLKWFDFIKNIQLDINKFKYFIGTEIVNELQKAKKAD